MSKHVKNDLVRHGGLYFRHVGIKGRGVFCRTDINPGTVLEVTPAIILSSRETDDVEDTILVDYTFSVGSLSARMRRKVGIRSENGTSAVVMGIMSYCNHSQKPNAEIEWEEKDGSVFYILKATRFISRDTEICTSYGEGWFGDRQKNKVKK